MISDTLTLEQVREAASELGYYLIKKPPGTVKGGRRNYPPPKEVDPVEYRRKDAERQRLARAKKRIEAGLPVRKPGRPRKSDASA